MQELVDQIAHYIRGIGRYRWQAMAIAWVVCLVGWAVTAKMPDQYQASTKFQVDTYSILQPILGGAIVDPSEKLRLTKLEVLSNTNIEKIVRKADLDLQVKNDAELDSLIQTVKNKISFQSSRQNDIFTITYTDTDPQVAKTIVQYLLDLFQEKALGDKRRDSDQAEKFLEEQITRYRTQLQDVESRLAEFKQENLNRLPEQGKDYYQRLQEAKSRVREATLELRQVENELDTLKAQLAKEKKLLNGSSAEPENVSIPEIDQRIAALNTQLDNLLLRYTDKHPDVVNTKRLIESLQEQKAKLLSVMESGSSRESMSNPIYQQLRIAIGDAEARRASLLVKVSEYKKRESELEALLHELPEIEEKLSDLTREYSIIKQHHDEMVAKREQARIQKEKEQSSNELKFELHDPPKTPSEPIGPNRLLFYAAVLVIGCGGGIGLAFILSQINTTFYDAKSLNVAISLPVIGSVSLILSEQQKRKRLMKRLLFVGSFLLLLTVYAGLSATEVMNVKMF